MPEAAVPKPSTRITLSQSCGISRVRALPNSWACSRCPWLLILPTGIPWLSFELGKVADRHIADHASSSAFKCRITAQKGAWLRLRHSPAPMHPRMLRDSACRTGSRRPLPMRSDYGGGGRSTSTSLDFHSVNLAVISADCSRVLQTRPTHQVIPYPASVPEGIGQQHLRNGSLTI